MFLKQGSINKYFQAHFNWTFYSLVMLRLLHETGKGNKNSKTDRRNYSESHKRKAKNNKELNYLSLYSEKENPVIQKG